VVSRVVVVIGIVLAVIGIVTGRLGFLVAGIIVVGLGAAMGPGRIRRD
jgi:type IV secretory pathway VirB2 component (pilin)